MNRNYVCKLLSIGLILLMVAIMPPAAAEEPDQILLPKKEGQVNLSWQMAPINPDFVHYQEKRMDQFLGTTYGEIRATGLIPSPVDLSHTKGMQVRPVSGKGILSYSQRFDLRDHGRVSPVKDQGAEGSCWAFGTYGSLESFFLPDEEWDFSENNMKNLVYSDFDSDDGGSEFMSTAYLARWSGPIREEDDPYVAGSTESPDDLPPVKHLDTVYFLPDRSDSLDNGNIKWALTEHGAVFIAMYWDDAYYNEDTSAFYTGTETSANHAVTVVGWDDTYSRAHFRSEPPGDGAFIIKNSWGTGWGDDGYFYISYYDTSLQRAVAFTAVDTTKYDRNYQYDPLGWVSSFGFGGGVETAWFANVFTALSDETLTAVSFYTAAPDSAYQIFIYTDPTYGPIGPGGIKATASGTIGVPGYHVIDLPDVELAEGQDFSAVVRLTTPGSGHPIPVEYPLEGYSSKATAHPGESYISPDGESWTDITILSENTNVCLKAFTAQQSPPAAAFTATPTTGPAPLSVQFTDESTGYPTAWMWEYSTGNPGWTEFSTAQHPEHEFSEAGTYSIRLTATNAAGADTETKEEYITVTAVPPPSDDYEFITKWGAEGSGDGQFAFPVGIAAGAAGNVYVVDHGNHRIQTFTGEGGFIRTWGTEGDGVGEFNWPYGIAVDAMTGNVYVADTENHRIQAFTGEGGFIREWGSSGSGVGEFDRPMDIAVDSDGNVYVADTGNDRIQMFSGEGTFIRKWGKEGDGAGQFNYPAGIAVDSARNVYVADWWNHRIQTFTSDGTFIREWGIEGDGDGQFNLPLGVAVDSTRNVYVADTNNDRIQTFTFDGDFITKWGSSGSGDGQFSYPADIAVDAAGNVYVVDSENHRIQKFGPGDAPPPVGWTGVFGNGHWFVNDGHQGVAEAWHFGAAGDEPFVLGDGRTGVFGNGHWFVNDGHQGVAEAWHFGAAGDIPFVLADGRTGVFGNGHWFVNDGHQGVAEAWHFGASGDRPFVLADGRTGVFGNGHWFVRDSATGGIDDAWHFGAAGDIPFVLADGRTGVFGNGHWFVNDGHQGIAEAWHFGAAGDRPVTGIST